MVIRNAAISWISTVLSMALALVVTPFVLSYVGAAVWGAWLILVGLVELCGLMDFGLATGLIKEASAAKGRGEPEEALRAARTCFSIYLLLTLCFAGFFGACSAFVERFFNIPPELVSDTSKSLLLLAPTMGVNFLARLYEGLLWSEERLDLVALSEILGNLAKVGLTMLFVWRGGGLWELVLAYSLGTLVFCGLIFMFSLRINPHARGLIPGWHRDMASKLFRFSRYTVLISLGNGAKAQLPVLIMGSLSSVVAVSQLGIGLRLIRNFLQVNSATTKAIYPRLARLAAKGGGEELHRFFLRTSFYHTIYTSFVGVGLFLLGKYFILLWVGEEFLPATLVLAMVALPATLNFILTPCQSMITALTRHLYLGWISLGEALLAAGLCLALIPGMGLYGAALAIAVSYGLLRPLLLPAYACRQIGLGLLEYWLKGVGRGMLPAALTYGVCEIALHHWRPGTWPEFLLAVVGVGAVFGLMLPVFLGNEERRFWWAKLKGLVSRR